MCQSVHVTITHDDWISPLAGGPHYPWCIGPHCTGTPPPDWKPIQTWGHPPTATDIWWLLKYVRWANGRYISYWDPFLFKYNCPTYSIWVEPVGLIIQFLLFGFRFAEMNRRLIDDYGTQASKLMPNYWPKYDPRYTSLTPDKIIRF